MFSSYVDLNLVKRPVKKNLVSAKKWRDGELRLIVSKKLKNLIYGIYISIIYYSKHIICTYICKIHTIYVYGIWLLGIWYKLYMKIVILR